MMDLTLAAALVGMKNGPGWVGLRRLASEALKQMNDELTACGDDTKVLRLQHEFRGAKQFWEKLQTAIDRSCETHIGEYGNSTSNSTD